MLDGPELDKAIEIILKRLRGVNTLYIRKVAAQIKKIGELNASSINRLVAMAEMGADVNEITEQLRLAAAISAKDLQRIFKKAVDDAYTDPRFKAFYDANPGAAQPETRANIEQYARAVYTQTAASLYNLSNTTAVNLGYRNAIDRAVLAASTGVASYTETIRQTVRELGGSGLQVTYASGYKRRLDTAVRQNIVDAVNQINKTASRMIGQEINEITGENTYDAIEISAHARSAPDHEPVQGRIFKTEEFDRMQAGLPFQDVNGKHYAAFKRPIGEWNCRHTPLSFSTKWSVPTWTEEQLQAMAAENRKGCMIDGKHKSLYQAMQMMREIETQVRREKDTAVAAQAAGDDALRQQCQQNINALVRRYAAIAKASGNTEKRQRMAVEGFRPVKVSPNDGGGLTSDGKSDMMRLAAPAQSIPDFSKYRVKSDPAAVLNSKQRIIENLGVPAGQVDLSGIQNADVLAPFVSRLEYIKRDTGMTIPSIKAAAIIDGDPACIAGFKPSEGTLYVSSQFFNSKEALDVTLKEWAERGVLPKQAKSIAYLAEHEAAHIRIPDKLLDTKEAETIWRKRKMTNDNDVDIYEYYADAVAIFRLSNKSTTDANILRAVDYLTKGGVAV